MYFSAACLLMIYDGLMQKVQHETFVPHLGQGINDFLIITQYQAQI